MQTDISLSQFLAIQEKGVSAWEFQPELEIANCFVEARTEIEFFDSECSVQTNLPVPKQNDVYYWEAKVFEKPETTLVSIGMSTKPYPLFRLPGGFIQRSFRIWKCADFLFLIQASTKRPLHTYRPVIADSTNRSLRPRMAPNSRKVMWLVWDTGPGQALFSSLAMARRWKRWSMVRRCPISFRQSARTAPAPFMSTLVRWDSCLSRRTSRNGDWLR